MEECCVPGCDGKSSSTRHRVPSDKRIADIWLSRVSIKDYGEDKSLVICGNHFHPYCLNQDGSLKNFAIPTLNLSEPCEELPCFSYPRIPLLYEAWWENVPSQNDLGCANDNNKTDLPENDTPRSILTDSSRTPSKDVNTEKTPPTSSSKNIVITSNLNVFDKIGKGICAAKYCDNTFLNCNYVFFKFPHNPIRAKMWAKAIGRSDLVSFHETLYKTHRLCSIHFEPKWFREFGNRKLLMGQALPTLFFAKKQDNTNQTFTEPLKDHDYCKFVIVE